MKKIIYIIIFSFCQLISAQKSYLIIYKAFPLESIEKSEKAVNSKIQYLYQDLDEAILSLRFELLVDDENVIFKTQDIIFKNERALKLAKTYTNSTDEYYFNIKDSISFFKKSFLNETFFIKNEEKFEWVITNETKTIDSLLCFKATTNREFKIKSNIKKIDIEAWFCPSIPISYGPKGFYGLPGLILQISDDKTKMLIEKISKQFKQYIIPKDEILITKKDFEEIVNKKKETFLEDKKN